MRPKFMLWFGFFGLASAWYQFDPQASADLDQTALLGEAQTEVVLTQQHQVETRDR